MPEEELIAASQPPTVTDSPSLHSTNFPNAESEGFEAQMFEAVDKGDEKRKEPTPSILVHSPSTPFLFQQSQTSVTSVSCDTLHRAKTYDGTGLGKGPELDCIEHPQECNSVGGAALRMSPRQKVFVLVPSLSLEQRSLYNKLDEEDISVSNQAPVDPNFQDSTTTSLDVDPSCLPFVLSSEQVKDLQRPVNIGPNINTSDYLKHIFNIDLDEVPGRTRKWSGLLGKQVKILSFQ